ncbi:TonB-dependent receptor [Jiulongibacter sp. NS-SX5]|uniref:TonB-dependent receptor n=1 Tax=Jiulongibacter sp. NS-SX5 TaxID=3463854 RepID=UPI00405A1646
MKLNLLWVFLLLGFTAEAQEVIEGMVMEKNGEVLSGAIIRWASDPSNAVFTNESGQFSIQKKEGDHTLICSFIGFVNDTLEVDENTQLVFELSSDLQQIDEVVVKGSSTAVDRIATQQTQIITSKELAKAACCNLAESFETNAAVSVSGSDAVTGARQLQMMGLSGRYVQTNIEGMPAVRGLSLPFGLNYVPGTWIQSIDISKGVSSVALGYEAISGAINVELHKPDHAERFFANAYVNDLGRAELNVHAAKKMKKWSVGLLTHGSTLQNEVNRNGDNFMDTPKYHQINLLNRWKYDGERFRSQFGVNFLTEDREGGEIVNPILSRSAYRFANQTQKLSFFNKMAVLFPETPYRGLGLIMDGSIHRGNSTFGLNTYDSDQNTFHSNLIYQDIIGNTQHTYKTGLSVLVDQYDEYFSNFSNDLVLQRTEVVPGAFFEYNYNQLDKTVVSAGLRADAHNLFGVFVTPRLHLKQELGSHTTLRASAGKGMRVPVPLAENYGRLVSNREVEFLDPISTEISWNFGSSLTFEKGKTTLILDAYHSEFKTQQVADMETAGKIFFYNSTERSFATSLQAELMVDVTERFDMKAAYRWQNVKQTMGRSSEQKELLPMAFLPDGFALLNLAYALPYNKWKFDATWQYRGPQRLPGQIERVRGFSTINSQIARNFVDWEYYLGAENLTNFIQENPIISSYQPYSESFDAGQIWGPVLGRRFYVGARYRIR